MRMHAAVLALLTASFASAQDLSKPVDYTSRALPFHTVLLDLSKQSGVKLEAEDTMQNEPLILRLNRVTLKDAMDKIAEVFQADWVDHQGFFRLERAPEKIRAIEKAVHDDRVARFKASLADLVAEQAKNPPLDDKNAPDFVSLYTKSFGQGSGGSDRRLRFAMQSRLPSMRLAVQILQRMDPVTLADLPTNTRVVFSTSPNSMQLPLPEIDPALIEQYKVSQLALSKALKVLTDEQRQTLYDLAGNFDAPAGSPAKIIAYTMPYQGPRILSLDFQVIDEKGNLMGEDMEALGTPFNAQMDARQKQALLRAEAVKDGFELGPVAKELADRTGSSTGQRPLVKFAVDALLVPTQQDPLSFATCDTILTSAARLNSNAIFLCDDRTESFALSAGRAGKTSLEAFQGVLSTSSGEQVNVDNGWIEGRPMDPLQIAESRIPRQPLEDLIRQSYEKTYVTIDQIADFWYRLPKVADAWYGIPQIGWLIENQAAYPLYAQADTARIYGSLSPVQRDTAATKAGLVLAAGQMTSDQSELLKAFTFNGEKEVKDANGQLSYGGVGQHLIERTELMPDGIPPDAVLKVTAVTKLAFYTHVTNDNYSFVYPANAEEVAGHLARRQHPELFKDWQPDTADSFQLGNTRTITLTLKAPGIEVSDSVTENQPPMGPPVPIGKLLETLPDGLRKEVQDKLNALLQKRQQKMSSEPTPTAEPAKVQPPAR